MNYLKSSCNEKKYIKNQMPLLKFMVHEIKEIMENLKIDI